ncbi:MAG: helix-turn-helix domain-containing protein, partial [Cyanobacteriota bacterium]
MVSCSFVDFEQKSYSYQHIQGVLLKNLNIIAYKIGLSNRNYRIMAILISYWNMNVGMAYPSMDIIAKNAKVSKFTVLQSIKQLSSLNLLIINKMGLRKNCYQFSEYMFNGHLVQHEKPADSFPCETSRYSNIYKNST